MKADIEIWVDQVASTIQDVNSPPCPPPPREAASEHKENLAPNHPGARKRPVSNTMDDENTPRPPKRARNILGGATPLSPSLSSTSADSIASDDLESHKSGRMSPTKQMAVLEDQDQPVIFCGFELSEAEEIPEDVEAIRAKAQRLADGLGILGPNPDALAEFSNAANPLSHRDLERFQYPFTIDNDRGATTGSLVPLERVQSIVKRATSCEKTRAHENEWNEEVHNPMIKMALEYSAHANTLSVHTLKAARIDPEYLASYPLPRRIIDYCYALKADAKIMDTWGRLQPLPKTKIKSWNNTTYNAVRSSPIAVNIETKAPDKSWTDGKPQLGIWTESLLSRLRLLVQYSGADPQLAQSIRIPAMPVIVVQGHDWHLLIVSQKSTPLRRKTTVWQKIDMGSTRNCFDTYKILASLHMLADWAETEWRPWFHSILEG